MMGTPNRFEGACDGPTIHDFECTELELASVLVAAYEAKTPYYPSELVSMIQKQRELKTFTDLTDAPKKPVIDWLEKMSEEGHVEKT
jgi:hypothetical protein